MQNCADARRCRCDSQKPPFLQHPWMPSARKALVRSVIYFANLLSRALGIIHDDLLVPEAFGC
jgi:hypothetical protein